MQVGHPCAESRRVFPVEAVLHADVMLEKIRKIGIVDGEECLQLLEKKGLDKRQRSLGSLELVQSRVTEVRSG